MFYTTVRPSIAQLRVPHTADLLLPY